MDCLDARLFLESVFEDKGMIDVSEQEDYQQASDHVHICGCEDCRKMADRLAGFTPTVTAA